MSVYKVPQDVEADDKLIGPFTFRQFIYLIITAMLGALAWWLFQSFALLAVIPAVPMIFFAALALPLKKDQPMEVYLQAIISFYLKPHRRIWDPDGIESLIQITVPQSTEENLTKDLSGSEAAQRLGYLAQIVDSQGWAVRGQGGAQASINSDVYLEAQQAVDMLDDTNNVAQSLDFMIGKSDQKRHQEVIDRMKAPQAPAALVAPTMPTPAPLDEPTNLQFNPYPTNMQQSVIRPLADEPAAKTTTPPTTDDKKLAPVAEPITPSTSEKVASPDIINLANNSELSIETIAREANRIQSQNDMEEEVVISLR